MTTLVKKKPRAMTDKQRAIVAAANARAAAIFGDAPVFDTPRVQPEALRRAILGTITRTWNNLPHVASLKANDIQIQYVGRIAFTKHAWSFDKNSKLVVRGSINLPALPATGTLSRADATDYLGYIVHEVGGHWLYTNPAQWEGACSRYARLPFGAKVSPAYARNVLNALEDVRIERELIASGLIRGAGACLRATLGTILDAARGNIEANDVRDFPFILAYAMREHAAAADLLHGMPKALRALYDYAATRMEAIRGRPLTEGTALADAIACEVLQRLVPLLPDKVQQGNPDGPEPGDGEPGDGEPGDGEPGDGDGEPEPGDSDSDSDSDSESGDGDGEPEPGDVTGDADSEPEPEQQAPAGDSAPGADKESKPDAITGDAETAGRDSNITLTGEHDDAAGAIQAPQIERVDVDEEMKERGAAVALRVKAFGRAPTLRGQVRRLLECTANDTHEGGKRSGRINAGALHRVFTGADTVFKRRTYMDGVRAAVAICIDGSGSMSGTMDQAVTSALVLADICHDANARVDVTVFHDARTLGDDMGYSSYADQFDDEARRAKEALSVEARAQLGARRCKLSIVKDWDESLSAGYARAGTMYAFGSTPDGAALGSVCERVLTQDAGRRVVIFVTDGQGDVESVMSACVRKYAARGVIIIAIGLGYAPSCPAYPYRVAVNGAHDLSNAGMREMLRALLASPAVQAVG